MTYTHWKAARLLLDWIAVGLLAGATLLGLAVALGLLLGVTFGMADWVRALLTGT